MRRIWQTLLAVALALVAVPLAAGEAGAAGTAHEFSFIRDGRVVSVVEVTANSSETGYVTSVANQSSAQGTFVLPKFTCTAEQNFDLSVQLEGPPNAAIGFVIVACGGPGALPFYEGVACAGASGLCGGATTILAAGDTVTITDTMTAKQASSTVDDLTDGKVSTTTGAGSATTTNSNFLVQRGTSTVPTFKKAKFTSCTVNGTPISSSDPSKLGPMTDAAGTRQVKSDLLNSAGDGFKTVFEHT
jgi:hypothetical protein